MLVACSPGWSATILSLSWMAAVTGIWDGYHRSCCCLLIGVWQLALTLQLALSFLVQPVHHIPRCRWLLLLLARSRVCVVIG